MDKSFENSWRLVLLTMLIVLAGSFIGLIPILDRHEYLWMAVSECALAIPILIGVRMLKGTPGFGSALFKGFSPALVPILVLIPFCMQNFILYITLPLEGLLYELFGSDASAVVKADSVRALAVQIFSICLVPAVMEEFLCRGVIMRLLKPYGTAVAVMVSALTFSMLHFSMTSFVVIFMLGVLMAAVKIMTGSIWACVLIHFSNNLAAMISEQLAIGDFAAQIVEITAAVLFPVLVFGMFKLLKPEMPIEPKRKKTGFSVSMVLCIMFFFMMIAAGLIMK